MKRFLIAVTFASLLVVPALASAQQATPQQNPAATKARELSDAFSAVAERVSPSVVQIDVTVREQQQDLFGLITGGGDSPIARGTGSGVIFTPDGGILTNNHVVENALTLSVRFKDGRVLPAKLQGRDPQTDLAVIKVDVQGLVAAKFGDSETSKVGEWVIAIGSPFGLGYSVTTGVLSAKGRGGLGMNAIEDYLQTDASINPGNSGGPLCNLDGQVLGINTMVVGRGQGIGFAVPSNMAKRVAEQLLKTGKVERAWIGVGVQDMSTDLAAAMKLDPRAGALVNALTDGGPAAKSQIKPGDVIASVGGKSVHDSHELVREVLAQQVGQTVALEVIRDGKHYGTNIVLAARPEPPIPSVPVQQTGVPQSGVGLAVRDLNMLEAQSKGFTKPVAIVSTVAPGSSADRAGLKVGDIIVEVDGVIEPNSQQVAQQAADGLLVLRLKRDTVAFYAAVKRP